MRVITVPLYLCPIRNERVLHRTFTVTHDMYMYHSNCQWTFPIACLAEPWAELESDTVIQRNRAERLAETPQIQGYPALAFHLLHSGWPPIYPSSGPASGCASCCVYICRSLKCNGIAYVHQEFYFLPLHIGRHVPHTLFRYCSATCPF